MSRKDEVVVNLDEPSSGHGARLAQPVDMVARLRLICRIFLVVFLVFFAVTIIVQGIMLYTWFTSTPLAICFFGILIVGFFATYANSFLFSNLLWWFGHPITGLILIAILIYGIVRLATGTGKYGKATIVPVIMLAVSTLGCGIGTFLFYKYSRFLKERRN